MHRSEFNSQSIQSQDQMNLFSTRYTSDIDSQTNRGFVPGNISDQLKVRKKQINLPIYDP